MNFESKQTSTFDIENNNKELKSMQNNTKL